MADVTGKVVTIKMRIQYTNGEEKTVTIPQEEAERIGALIFDEEVYGKICSKQFDSTVKEGFTEFRSSSTCNSAFADKVLKNTLGVIYKDDEVMFACGGGTHPPQWH